MIAEPERLRPDHAAAMFAGLADPRGHAFIPSGPPEDIDALEQRFARLAGGAPPGRDERWRNRAIRDPDRDVLLGWTQATITGRIATVAYQVLPAEWGRGVRRGGRRHVPRPGRHAQRRLDRPARNARLPQNAHDP